MDKCILKKIAMVVTAMDINLTYKNSKVGNGDGYKRDN